MFHRRWLLAAGPRTAQLSTKRMKADDNSKTSPKIKLSKTFFKIAAGEVLASDVAKKKQDDKEAARAEAIRKGRRVERTDPFISNFGR